MKYPKFILLTALSLGWLILAVPRSASAAPYTVTSTDDMGAGSLRQAIADANADASPGAVTIDFNIAEAGVQTIAPLTPLPNITRSVIIDGYTQPGASANTLAVGSDAFLLIELTGTNTTGANGLFLNGTASNSTVRGLVINRFSSGINMEPSGGHVFEGNYIGTDATGTNAQPNEIGLVIGGTDHRIGGLAPAARNVISGNSFRGVWFNGATSNQFLGNYVGLGPDGNTSVTNVVGIYLSACFGTQIGGTSAAARNVISANGTGVYDVGGGDNIYAGNFVGTDATGTLPRGNTGTGISTVSDSVTIGGTNAGAGNLISGRNGTGLVIASSTLVAANLIGTDVTGQLGLGNEYDGVLVFGTNNLIGGTAAAARNVIAANRYGIFFFQPGASENRVLGNFIGTDITGTNALGNAQGVYSLYSPRNVFGGPAAGEGNVISGNTNGAMSFAEGATNNIVQGNFIGTDLTGTIPLPNGYGLGLNTPGNLVGGTGPGEGNVIAANAGIGVVVGETNNAIIGNSIFDNGTLGIDLFGDGVTPNDPDDADGSPNHYQNFPAIVGALSEAGQLTVRYRVDSAPENSSYPLTVEFFVADSAASGEGKTLIYRHSYETPQALTNVIFTPLAGVSSGDPIAATATDAAGNTSEFSAVTTAMDCSSLSITTTSLPNATRTVPYSQPIAASGGTAPYTFTVTSGMLPDGLNLSSDGTLSGTPTVLNNFAFNVTVTDDFGCTVMQAYHIVVGEPCPSITLSPASLPAAPTGQSYDQTITASGGTAPYTFALTSGALPNSLMISSGGQITGTATTAGAFMFTVTATDNAGCSGSSNYTITAGCLALTLGPPSTNICVGAGVPFSIQFTATGGRAPYTFDFDMTAPFSLPAGGANLSSGGTLTGTPTLNTNHPAGSNYTFIIHATDTDGCQGRVRYFLRVLPTNTFVTAASQVNRAIPPVGTGGSGNANNDILRSTNVVSGLTLYSSINRVTVTLSLEHPSAGDLILTLVSPRGDRVLLSNRRGGSGADYMDTIFYNDADTSITTAAAPFTGLFQPEVGLGFTGGTNLNGNWVLEIEDAASGGTGFLRDWCLTLTPLPSNPNIGPVYFGNSFGNFLATDSHLIRSLHQTYMSSFDSLFAVRSLDGTPVWTNALGAQQIGRASPIDRSFQRGPLVVVSVLFATPPGAVMAFNPTNGNVVWSNAVLVCAGSRPVVQSWNQSGSAFRAAHPTDDLVFVASACNDSTSKVFALRASDGSLAWTFNLSGAFALYIGELAVNASADTLYCGTVGPTNTIFALNTLNGALRWTRNLGFDGSTGPFAPLVVNGAVFVAGVSNSVATLHKLNAGTGATVWTRSLGTRFVESPVLFDPYRQRLVLGTLLGSTLFVNAIDDTGATGANAWEYSTPVPNESLAIAWVIAPEYDQVVIAARSFFNPAQSARIRVSLANGGQLSLTQFLAAFDMIGDSDNGGVFVDNLVTVPFARQRFPVPLPTAGPPAATNDLAIAGIVSPANPRPGDQVTCTLTVTNRGATAVSPLHVGDVLPTGLSFVSARISRGTYSISTNKFVADLGVLMPNGSATISLVLTSRVDGMTLEHSATVGGYAVDPLGDNNSVVFSHFFGTSVRLSIQRANSDVIISWPTDDPDLKLTSNNNLNMNNWVLVDPAPVIVGGRYTVTNAITAGQKFYRLQNP